MTVKDILKNLEGVNPEMFEVNSSKHMAAISLMNPEELVEVITVLSEKGYSLVKESGIINYALASCTREEAELMPIMNYTDGLGRVA